MLRSVLAFLACLAVTSVMGFAPPLGVQRTVVRASAPTMQFGGSALDGMNEELQKVTVCGESRKLQSYTFRFFHKVPQAQNILYTVRSAGLSTT